MPVASWPPGLVACADCMAAAARDPKRPWCHRKAHQPKADGSHWVPDARTRPTPARP